MAKPLILAVDDSGDLLALMARALAADYEVKTAAAPPSARPAASAAEKPA